MSVKIMVVSIIVRFFPFISLKICIQDSLFKKKKVPSRIFIYTDSYFPNLWLNY